MRSERWSIHNKKIKGGVWQWPSSERKSKLAKTTRGLIYETMCTLHKKHLKKMLLQKIAVCKTMNALSIIQLSL